MGLMSVALSSCTAVAFNLHLGFFSLPFLYHLLRAQEGATHPWFNLSSWRRHSGATSPGTPPTHCGGLGEASHSAKFSAFLGPLSLFKSKATGHHSLPDPECQL